MLLLDGQVHHDTHVIPMGNYVIEAGNYVIATPSELGNYLIADTLGPDRSGNVIADDLICHPRQDCSVPADQGEPIPGVLKSTTVWLVQCITRQKAHTGRTAARSRVRALCTAIPGQAPILPAMMSLQTTGNYAACGCLPGRGVLPKSHIGPGNLARRLRIEATYPL